MSEARHRQAVSLWGQARATSRWKPWERQRLLERALEWALGTDEEEVIPVSEPITMPSEDTENGRTIFQRLRGVCGDDIIAGIVIGMYDRIYADELVMGFFRHVDRATLEKKMMRILTAILNNSNWSPELLREIHKAYKIQDKHFNAVVAHAVASMRDQRVPERFIDEIGAVVLTLREYIVNTPDDAE